MMLNSSSFPYFFYYPNTVFSISANTGDRTFIHSYKLQHKRVTLDVFVSDTVRIKKKRKEKKH